MKYRKKPVVIEAIQYVSDDEKSNTHVIEEFVGKGRLLLSGGERCLMIPTLEGEHIATPGDFIIKGVKGECYPCKPDIFEMTYEKVD